MSKEFDYKKVREVISEKPLTAEEIAAKLDVKLTQDNRKKVLSKIRRAARRAVEKFNGKKEVNGNGQLTYYVEE